MNSVVPSRDRSATVAIPRGNERDGIAEVISDELNVLGYQPVHFQIGSLIPEKSDVVFSFGPYGKFLTIPRQLAKMPLDRKSTRLNSSHSQISYAVFCLKKKKKKKKTN